eukprot:TRINITY_DN75682_c0_g1_i1.p1 TRINITY_DN75682_c0_g1~~TRINITY_DN75682_c0_g1_i1.p1  ORF type:complete len:403 (+),score=63.53 TRINITY_DN75682_c0_g1_i1:190-1398(+)
MSFAGSGPTLTAIAAVSVATLSLPSLFSRTPVAQYGFEVDTDLLWEVPSDAFPGRFYQVPQPDGAAPVEWYVPEGVEAGDLINMKSLRKVRATTLYVEVPAGAVAGPQKKAVAPNGTRLAWSVPEDFSPGDRVVLEHMPWANRHNDVLWEFVREHLPYLAGFQTLLLAYVIVCIFVQRFHVIEPQGDKVTITMTFTNVDFVRLKNTQKLNSAFMAGVQEEVAKAAGNSIKPSDVKLDTLSQTPFILQASIRAPSDKVSLEKVKEALVGATTISVDVRDKVRGLEGLKQVGRAEIMVCTHPPELVKCNLTDIPGTWREGCTHELTDEELKIYGQHAPELSHFNSVQTAVEALNKHDQINWGAYNDNGMCIVHSAGKGRHFLVFRSDKAKEAASLFHFKLDSQH